MSDDPHDVNVELELVGLTIEGRYQVTRLIGEGGMGKVYLALDTHLPRKVVFKVPKVQLLADPEFRARFEREIKSLIGLEHPHVLKVLDVGAVRGVPYAMLQYLAGGNLDDRLEAAGRPMKSRDVLEWLPDVARALDFIHRKGFVHRDIKPGNIMFDENGFPFIGDFGIVRALGDEESALTRTGLTPGSPRYMAPEAALGLKSGPPYDQYSLAVVVYRVLCGKTPHSGDTPLAIVTKKAVEPPMPLGPQAPDLPGEAAAVVMKALSREPADRYASCDDFAKAFADAILSSKARPARKADDDATMTLRSEDATGPARARGRWGRRLLIATVIGGIAAAGWIFRDRVPEDLRRRAVELVSSFGSLGEEDAAPEQRAGQDGGAPLARGTTDIQPAAGQPPPVQESSPVQELSPDGGSPLAGEEPAPVATDSSGIDQETAGEAPSTAVEETETEGGLSGVAPEVPHPPETTPTPEGQTEGQTEDGTEDGASAGTPEADAGPGPGAESDSNADSNADSSADSSATTEAEQPLAAQVDAADSASPPGTSAPSEEPTTFVQPPVATPPDPIAPLLAEAREHRDHLRLTSGGRNAATVYREALALDPDNEEARAGLAWVRDYFVERGKESEAQGDPAEALNLYQKAVTIAPSPEVDEMIARLEKAAADRLRDDTPPSVTLFQPADGAAVQSGTVAVVGLLRDGDLASVGADRCDCVSEPNRFECKCEVGEGEHVFRFRLRDASGNESVETLTIEGLRSTMSKPVAVGGLHALGRNPQGHAAFERESDGMRVVLVTGGTFLMGAAGASEDEAPEHQVTLSPYLMDEAEVSWAQFMKLQNSRGVYRRTMPSAWKPGPDEPVQYVTWGEASDYCEWVGGRLPTEAEWEFAARGTDGRVYPWGNTYEDGKANIDGTRHDIHPYTAPVGTYPGGASPFGMYNMAANVTEWVADWYGPYSSAPASNPRGPSSGTERVHRGGDFTYKTTENLRATRRNSKPPDIARGGFGFRCAMNPP